MWTMVILVVCTSIILFFLDEFSDLFNQIKQNKKVFLWVSLTVLSSLIVIFQNDLEIYLNILHLRLREALFYGIQALPFRIGAIGLVIVFFVMFFSFFPTFIFYWFAKRQEYPDASYWASMLYLFLWVILMMLVLA